MSVARFEAKGIADYIRQLDIEADRVRRRGPAAIDAGVKIAIQALKDAAPVSPGGGTLRDSIQEFAAKRQWNSAEIQPMGAYEGRKKPKPLKPGQKKSRYRRASEWPVRTQTVAFILEYGTSRIRPRGWMLTATERSGEAISQAMLEEIMKDE